MLEARQAEASAWALLLQTYAMGEIETLEEPPVDRVRRALHAEGEGLVVAARQRGPPVMLDELLQLRGIGRLKREEFSFRDGVLLVTEDGFELRVNSAAPVVRQRAAIAHEIGHTFFYDIEARPPRKLVDFPKERYWVEEGIAREIGRAILVPRGWIKREAAENASEWDLETVLRLCDRYQVSADIMAHRLVRDLACLDSYIFFADPQSGGQLTFGISSANRFRGKSFETMKIPTLIGKDHGLFRILLDALSLEPGQLAVGEVRLGAPPRPLAVQVGSLKRAEGVRLIGMISKRSGTIQAKLEG